MLSFVSKGMKMGELKDSPFYQVVGLYLDFQNESREEVLHGMPRLLALASHIHDVLEGTEYDYNIGFLNRHYTLCVYKKHEEYFEMTAEMHPQEIIRITETEEGR